MTAAFNPVPAPGPDRTLSLPRLADCNALLLRHCANLRRLPLYLGECGADPQARAAITDLLAFFDTALPRQHAALDRVVMPALLESMAGSDAVCLQQLGAALAMEHAQLQGQWRALRPALLELAAGRPAPLAAQPVEALIACCQESAARAADEVLPMAARLLSEEQLGTLGATGWGSLSPGPGPGP